MSRGEKPLEQTLVLIKPDAVQRGLIGEIIMRLEKRGLKVVAAKFVHVTRQFAEKHYMVHKGKPFFNGLVKYLTSTPLFAMIWEGENAVKAVRQIMGATDPLQAEPGTIRHDLALKISRNLTHASDSPETAQAEIALWFKPEEIFAGWRRDTEEWIFGNN
jgi:nucleoside-diphosphate kinase